MEASTLIFAAGAATVCLLTWAATAWWYRRQLRALALRLGKTDRARQYALEQVTQARKQVEKLQRELSESRRSIPAAPQSGSQRRPTPSTSPVSAETPAPSTPTARPANGFADTMPM